MTKYFEQRLDEENIKSKKVAWWAFTAMTLVCFALTITIMRMTPLKRTEVKVLVVDKNTGLPTEVTSLATFETGNVRQMSDIEALNKYFTNQYIVAHDSYNYYAIRNDYSTVQIYSTQEVFDDYKKKFEPPASIEKQLGKDKNLEISVVTIEQEDIPTPFKGEEDTGVTMRARIDKTIRNGDQILSRQSGIVTLTFGYDADLDMDEKARNMNPLGFVVTSYKFTPDMATDAKGAEAADESTDGEKQ